MKFFVVLSTACGCHAGQDVGRWTPAVTYYVDSEAGSDEEHSGVRIKVACIFIFLCLWHGDLFSQSPNTTGSSYPNIILIVADDFGYGDLSSYGSRKTHTPHVDRLASDGMRFTNAYVASSLCSPSRYSILTGRYSWRTHLKTGVLKSFSPPLIEEGRTTLASLLKRKGYSTACVGKWHLGLSWALKETAPADAARSVFDTWGTEPQQYIDFSKPVKGGPLERGFDSFYGIAGSNNMIPFVFIRNEDAVAPPAVPNEFGPATLRATDWDLKTLDDKLTQNAVDIIDTHFADKSLNPLFLYFATSAVHLPCLPNTTRGSSNAGLRGDMVVQFDLMVGKIVNALKRNGALTNTLIIVTSDNGPVPGDPYGQIERFKANDFGDEYDYYQPYFAGYEPVYRGAFGHPKGWITYDHDPTAGLLGFKSDAWEGGLRVPFIAHWPGKIRNGTVNEVPICLTDLFATFAEITDSDLTEDEGEDSYSFLSNAINPGVPPARTSMTLVAGRSGAMVVRKGSWKYIEAVAVPNRSTGYPPPPNEYPGVARVDEIQLYNLEEDTGEKRNLAGRMPDKIVELQRVLEQVKETKKREGK